MKYIASLMCLISILSMACGHQASTLSATGSRQDPVIIDHTCTDLDRIPEAWINAAKKNIRIAYGHTSHGSQIISGMERLYLSNKLYSFGNSNFGNKLVIFDREPEGDLGNPDREAWAQRTREYLRSWGDVNVVMWSWCGQVSSANSQDILTYLELMQELENDFPEIVFVYMTGHLDGTGERGNLAIRNNQIRQFCREKNKVLFDFADVESHDPDGRYLLDKFADDGCYYRYQNEKRNWADEWCEQHPGNCESYDCAHSRSLNCDLKARAFWWMMARLAGWEGAG
jgi:hypothetical protein